MKLDFSIRGRPIMDCGKFASLSTDVTGLTASINNPSSLQYLNLLPKLIRSDLPTFLTPAVCLRALVYWQIFAGPSANPFTSRYVLAIKTLAGGLAAKFCDCFKATLTCLERFRIRIPWMLVVSLP